MFTLVTTRYDNKTWQETLNYRIRRRLNCIYGPPCPLSEKIELGTPVFVIEMNNSINQIMGIGLINNRTEDRTYKIYEDTNFNRYIYIGKYHISREILDEYNSLLVYILDEILFKGKTHSKRGAGLTKIPEKVLKLEICERIDIKKEIKKIFIYHFRDKVKLENNNIENNNTEK
jgi:hypothetical protein